MSRISKKRLLKILKDEYEEPTYNKKSLLEYLAKPVTQEEWLKEYNEWKRKQLAND